MFQGEKEVEAAMAVDDDLEPYRRLVDLQKQMIELAQQHEKTKRECAVLRTQLLDEMTRPRLPRWNLGRGIGRKAAGWVKGLAASWRFREESCPQPNGSFLSQDRF